MMIKIVALNTATIIGVIILGFGLMNAPALWKKIKFAFNQPTEQSQSKSAQINSNSQKTEPNRLKIPSLGIEAPLVTSAEANENSYQEALQTGVVHFPGTAKVGESGNAYYFGHSSDFAFVKGNFKTVFALLPNIELGAEVVVTNSDGLEFKYLVIDKKVVNKNDVSVLEQGDGKEKLLSLQTSYPVGTALQRYVVVARLVEQIKK